MAKTAKIWDGDTLELHIQEGLGAALVEQSSAVDFPLIEGNIITRVIECIRDILNGQGEPNPEYEPGENLTRVRQIVSVDIGYVHYQLSIGVTDIIDPQDASYHIYLGRTVFGHESGDFAFLHEDQMKELRRYLAAL